MTAEIMPTPEQDEGGQNRVSVPKGKWGVVSPEGTVETFNTREEKDEYVATLREK